MPYTRNGAVRLYYETFGDGSPLVLIMGLGGNIQAWGLQIASLASRHRLIVFDNRGAGRSDKPDEPYDMASFAADTIAVMDAADVSSAHILGVSMGGLIAQELYHRYPERVRSLILGCTGVGPADPAAVPPDPAVMAALRLDRRRESPRRIIEAMTEAFYHPQYLRAMLNLVAKLVKLQETAPQPAHAFERQLQACYQPPYNSPRLAAVAVPTLVLHGEHDRVWPLANAEYLARHIPGAKLRVIPDSAHMFMLERPREFNQAVLDFLSELETEQ